MQIHEARTLEDVAEQLLGHVPQQMETVHTSARGGVYRLACAEGSRILKWSPGGSHEADAYRLLQRMGVPTPRVLASCQDALLIEDLSASTDFRLARSEGVLGSGVGTAVAAWYRLLHAAGLSLPVGERPEFLKRETDELSAQSVEDAAQRLGLERLGAWRVVAEHVESLKARYAALPTTVVYNDFHWSNLALARTAPQRAVVFDYHLLGIGPAASDYRNVLTCLGPVAGSAFRRTYGRMDERALALDAPLAALYSLVEASRRDVVPRWAGHLIEQARSGELERAIRRVAAP